MTTVSEAVAQRDATPAKVSRRDALRDLVERNSTAVGQSLPAGISQDRFVRLLLTAANTNPRLIDCDPRSFLAAGVACAQLGLEPNDPRGLAYLVPFKDKDRGEVVTLILGYKGMLDLARRSGMVTSVNAFPVFEGDAFSYQLGLEPTLHHVPHPDGTELPQQLTYVYAVAKVGGDKQFVVLSRRQIDRVKEQYARSSQSPWHTHYVEMALKTAIRRLCKWLPQTVELARGIDAEERGLVLSDELAMPAAIGHTMDDHDEQHAIEAQISDDEDMGEPPSTEAPSGSGEPREDAPPQPGGRRGRKRPASASDAPPPPDQSQGGDGGDDEHSLGKA